MKKRTSKTPSEQLQDELEPILQWEDEGGYQPPMEYDESDDIEDAKNAIERKLISFVAVEKINALKIYNIEEIARLEILCSLAFHLNCQHQIPQKQTEDYIA